MNATGKTHVTEKNIATRRTHEQAARASGHSQQVSTANRLKSAMTDLPSTLRPEDVLALQRAIGNRAVQSIIAEQIERSDARDLSARSLIHTTPVAGGIIQRQPEEDEEQEGEKPSPSDSFGFESELPQTVVDQPAPIENQNAEAPAFNQPIGVPDNGPAIEFAHGPAESNAEAASSAGTPDMSSALMLIKKLLLMKKLKQR